MPCTRMYSPVAATRAVDNRRLVSDSLVVHYPAGEIWVRKGYVLVKDNEIPNLYVARRALDTIDSTLIKAQVRNVVFDTRELPPPSPEINAVYWEWVVAGKYHDRVALLVRSDMKRIEGNMNAVSKGVLLRSFHTIEEAEVWLNRVVPKPRRQ